MKTRIAYLCLQATREGQASYAHVHEIIKGLNNDGWKVELFEPNYARKTAPANPIEKIWAFFSVQVRLWQTARRIDALYIRAHPAALPSALWAKVFGIPTIQEINGPYDDLFVAFPWTRFLAPIFRRVIRAPLAVADALIVVTPQLQSWVTGEVGPKLVYVIPNGANTELFCPEAPLQLDLPKPYVVFVGALTRWQGIDTILQAVESPIWPSEVRLVVVGDGVEREKVEAAARNPKVICLGQIPYHGIPGIIANSIAGLSPQNNEGGRSDTGLFPLKVFETLSCSIPVIVTDFPGQADLVRSNFCGFVIPPEDPGALAQAIAYLYKNPKERESMGGKGRSIVRDSHSWTQRAKDTGGAIRTVIEKRNAA